MTEVPRARLITPAPAEPGAGSRVVPEARPVTGSKAGSGPGDGTRERPFLITGEGEFDVRIIPSDVPPSLELRLPGPGEPADLVNGARYLDLLRGSEVWRAVTPLTMLAGLRDTVTVERLLAALDVAWLDDLRIRVDTDHPGTARPDTPRPGSTHPGSTHPITTHPITTHPITAHPITTHPITAHPISGCRRALRPQSRTSGTLDVLSLLQDFPARNRAELTRCATEAAERALRRPQVAGDPEAATALRWVVMLAGAFPDDPMALAPLLFPLCWFEAGTAFLIPARWPVALLSGDAVGVHGRGSVLIGAGLGARNPDPPGFWSALESGSEGRGTRGNGTKSSGTKGSGTKGSGTGGNRTRDNRTRGNRTRGNGPEGGGTGSDGCEPDDEAVARALQVAWATAVPSTARPARHAMPLTLPPAAPLTLPPARPPAMPPEMPPAFRTTSGPVDRRDFGHSE